MGIAFGEGDVSNNGVEHVGLFTAAGAELLGAALSAASLPVVLPTDIAPVPTKTDRERHLTNGTLYVASAAHAYAGPGFENELVITNPAGSGVTVTIFAIETFITLGATTSQLNSITSLTRQNPADVTGGTTIATRNQIPGGSDVTQTTVVAQPTSVTTLGQIFNFCHTINAPCTMGPFRLNPGDSILVQCSMNDAANAIFSRVEFGEE